MKKSYLSQEDQDNLRFLLTVDKETLQDWFNTVSDEDIEYAVTLLEMFRMELIDEAAEKGSLQESTNVLSYIMDKE